MSAPGGLDRRLAAVWFADIVGFTRLADADEDAARALRAVAPQCDPPPRCQALLESLGLADVPLSAAEPAR